MFKIYDLNMKELPFPEGVKPLDIFVSSVNKRRLTEEFEGRSGTLNYGYDYGERSVDLSLWLEAHDTIDYRLIRNELYAFFDTHDVFYIEETRVPSRVLKVTIDESYIPERINQTHSLVEISCRTLDSVFWESKYTTLELHDSGYSATAEKYGLVDNIDDEKVKYRFSNDTSPLTIGGWNNGGIATSNGDVNPYNINNIYSDEIVVSPGDKIDFEDTADHQNINFWRAFEYDGSTFIRMIPGNPGTNTLSFTPTGNRIRFSTSIHSGMPVRAENVGLLILPKVTTPKDTSAFIVYNAGNVAVEPESMSLNIYIKNLITGGNFTIRNKTTGDTFIMERSSDNFELRIKGMVVGLGGISNIFRNTNRRFIKLVPGDNEFEILNGTFEEIGFEFKYLYK